MSYTHAFNSIKYLSPQSFLNCINEHILHLSMLSKYLHFQWSPKSKQNSFLKEKNCCNNKKLLYRERVVIGFFTDSKAQKWAPSLQIQTIDAVPLQRKCLFAETGENLSGFWRRVGLGMTHFAGEGDRSEGAGEG